MFARNVDALVAAKTADEEEFALAQLLRTARESKVDYGYRVFSVTTKQVVPINEVHNHLDDQLEVTIMFGAKPPHQEIVWRPKYNGHITRLVMP